MSTRMRPRTALVAATFLAATSLAATGSALANPGGTPAIPFNTEQETTGSDTGASGFFTYTISGTQLCYTLTPRDLSLDAVAAHIHQGARNVAGPVVIPPTVGTGTSFSRSACTTASATLLAGIQADPKAYYVNVHTRTFPGGEIRGQLKYPLPHGSEGGHVQKGDVPAVQTHETGLLQPAQDAIRRGPRGAGQLTHVDLGERQGHLSRPRVRAVMTREVDERP